MPKHIKTKGELYLWYRNVCHYSRYASIVSTLMHFEGFKSPRLTQVKRIHQG